MQRFFSIIIIFGILVAGGGYLYNRKANEEAQKQIAQSLADARRSFAEKARSGIAEDSGEDYVRQISASIRAYDEELKKSVYKKKPEWRDVEKKKKQIELDFKEKKLTEAQLKGWNEGYKIVKEAYDVLMKGNWKPVLTAEGKAETRLDIYEFRRIRDDEGNPLLEGRFFFWGIEDSTRVNWGELALRYWVEEEPDAKTKRARKKAGEDPDAPFYKVLGKAEGESTPRLIIQAPSKYIEEFPSYVSVGMVWLPVMPRQAKKVDIKYGYSAKKGGSEYESVLEWPEVKIPSRWKLEEGEDWEADEVEATEDEIAGVEPDAGVAAEETGK